MRTEEILTLINESGGFDNFNHWSEKEVAQWVRSNYNCSYYVSIKVARVIA